MASVGAGWGCGGLCPRALPRQGGGLGPGDFLPGGGRLGRPFLRPQRQEARSQMPLQACVT